MFTEVSGLEKSHYKILMITINGAWKHGNIGIDQLTGYLRKNGFNVDIIYCHKRDRIEEIFQKIKDEYNFYGFSVTSSNYEMCKNLACLLKNYSNDNVIDFGGGYVTRYYREVLRDVPSLDFITLGDGEIPTEYLLNQLIKNPNYILHKKTGHDSVASRNDVDSKIQFLNTVIDYLPAFDYYETDKPERNARKVHCIQTKNNVCTGNCSFCTERHGKVCYKNIDFIIEQIKIVHDRFGVHKIFFSDDNIFDPNDINGKQHVKQLCMALKNLNFKMAYQCYIKAISLKDTSEDNEILALMKEVGFVEVFVGIESGDDDDLKLYNKFTTVEDNYTIIRILKRHELTPIMGFIGFNPYSTFKKIANNFKFLIDVECTYLSNYLYCFVNVNKYTSIYDMIKKDNLMLSSDEEYINISYDYLNSEVTPILRYIHDNMLPKVESIDYELDWVCYAYEEHKVWYDDILDYSEELERCRKEYFEVLKKYLSILLVDHDLERFKIVEDDFWEFFSKKQILLKEIYDYLISIDEKTALKQLSF